MLADTVALLDALGLDAFYEEMADLAKLNVAQRRARLESWLNTVSNATRPAPQPG